MQVSSNTKSLQSNESRKLRNSARTLFPALHSGVVALCVCLAVFAGLATHSAVAQSAATGAIVGTVTDSNGALLPNTIVKITSTETNVTRTVKTSSSGEYRINDLAPGNYVATFTADGFETAQ
jgi:hypothetical protein